MNRPLLLTLALLVGCTGTTDKVDDTAEDTGDTGADTVNTPPTAPVVRITPEGATSLDDLVASLETPSTDADGDDVTYTYAWSRNGNLVPELVDDTVPADRLTRGDIWSVTVTPTDGVDEGVSASDDIVITNAPAELTLTLDPEALDTNSVAHVVASGADPDGDPLTYTFTWYVNDTVVGDATDTLDGALWFDKGDVVVAEVTAADPGGSATTERVEVTVGNLPPEAATVAIDPSAPTPGASFVCEVSAFDPDADVLSYAISWTRDGAAFTGATTTTHPGDTIPEGLTVVGESWTCTATPSDDVESGPSGSATAVITDWTGPRNFTTCGATGQFGPEDADCAVAYAGTTLEGEVVVGEGLQAWMAPVSGDFRIQACGAQGASGTTDYVGGKGACVEGTFTLASGDVLLIAVGQIGSGQSSGSNGGGGGGTFVVAADDVPLLIAGGGGGTRTEAYQDGCDALATEFGVTGLDNPTHSCDPLTDGAGEGGIASSSSWGSGGAGFNSDGGGDSPWGVGGKSWFNGLQGGDDGGYSCAENAYGGFGGGGAGNGCYGGGGGGGWSGGQGGWIAGGAGSYNAGADPAGTDGANEGDGWLTIDLAD